MCALETTHNQFCGKLDPKVVKCMFISYTSDKKRITLLPSFKLKYFTHVNVILQLTEPFYMWPQVQGEGSIEAKFFLVVS